MKSLLLLLLLTSNYPTDGVCYTASSNLNSPADRIRAIQVDATLYGDVTINTVNLAGLDSNSVYFVSRHAVSNVIRYNTMVFVQT
jgi:hypothetical protein